MIGEKINYRGKEWEVVFVDGNEIELSDGTLFTETISVAEYNRITHKSDKIDIQEKDSDSSKKAKPQTSVPSHLNNKPTAVNKTVAPRAPTTEKPSKAAKRAAAVQTMTLFDILSNIENAKQASVKTITTQVVSPLRPDAERLEMAFESACNRLARHFAHYEQVEKSGNGDPSCSDGEELNQTRRSICKTRERIQELVDQLPVLSKQLPDIWNTPIPEVKNARWTAQMDAVRSNACHVLAVLEANSDYAWLKDTGETYSPEAKKRCHLAATLSYIDRLRKAIEEDDGSVMRWYQQSEKYEMYFRTCRDSLEKHPVSA